MALTKITLESIANLDHGRIGEAFQQKLDQAVQDCEDRPGIKSGRVVSIKVMVKPKADEAGNLDSITLGHAIAYSEPKRESRLYSAKRVQGGLVLNELAPHDVDQLTLDDAMGPTATKNPEAESA